MNPVTHYGYNWPQFYILWRPEIIARSPAPGASVTEREGGWILPLPFRHLLCDHHYLAEGYDGIPCACHHGLNNNRKREVIRNTNCRDEFTVLHRLIWAFLRSVLRRVIEAAAMIVAAHLLPTYTAQMLSNAPVPKANL